MPVFNVPSLKFKNFKMLFLASTISELGSFITETGLMLYIFSLVGESKSWLGLERATFIGFYMVGSLLGGGLQNIPKYRNILIFSNLIRVPLLLWMMTVDSPVLLIIISGAISFFQGIFSPLKSALMNVFVPQSDIKNANSIMGTAYAILHLICPYLGAYLFTLFNSIFPILSLDLATYLLSILFLLNIKNINYSQSEEKKSFKFDHHFLFSNPIVKTIMINYLIIGFIVGILIPLLVPYSIEVLGETKKEYGLLMLAFGSGGLIGGLLSEKMNKLYPSNKVVLSTFLIECFMMLTWIQVSSLYLSMIGLFTWGVVVFIRVPSQFNLISETIPTEKLALVHGVLQIAFVLTNLGGGLIVAMIGDDYTSHQMLYTGGLIFAALGGIRVLSKDFRSLWKKEIIPIDRKLDQTTTL